MARGAGEPQVGRRNVFPRSPLQYVTLLSLCAELHPEFSLFSSFVQRIVLTTPHYLKRLCLRSTTHRSPSDADVPRSLGVVVLHSQHRFHPPPAAPQDAPP